MNKTSIEWCDFTINPIRARRYRAVNGPPGSPPFEIVGNGHYCEKIAPGCKNCYASKLQPRFGMPQFQEQRGAANIEPYLDLSKLQKILRHRKPGRVFWCDMTDMFGHWVPDEWLDEIFATMALTPHLTHLVLTKRADRMHKYFAGDQLVDRIESNMDCFLEELVDCNNRRSDDMRALAPDLDEGLPLPNVWLGVSASTNKCLADQVPWLLKTPAAVRFLSAEPLLEDLTGIRRYLDPLGQEFCQNCGDDARSSLLHSEIRWDKRGDAYCSQCGARRAATGYNPDGSGWIDWTIVGGESGQQARPCHVDWVRNIVTATRGTGTACFVKQLGANPSWPPDQMRRLKDRKGGDPAEWPEQFPREFPR